MTVITLLDRRQPQVVGIIDRSEVGKCKLVRSLLPITFHRTDPIPWGPCPDGLFQSTMDSQLTVGPTIRLGRITHPNHHIPDIKGIKCIRIFSLDDHIHQWGWCWTYQRFRCGGHRDTCRLRTCYRNCRCGCIAPPKRPAQIKDQDGAENHDPPENFWPRPCITCWHWNILR